MSLAYCDWCHNLYDLTPQTEIQHLMSCDEFQNRPVTEVKDGKEFVTLPGHPHILIEKYPKRGN